MFNQLDAASAMTALSMADWEATVMAADTVLGTASAPNVVGILEGTDPTLKQEYVVFSAHMDHIGISAGRPDSINNGADDDGSGTVGILELAEAFTRKKAATKRSLIFLTVSGEEKGLWGSAFFTAHPPVPIGQIVANLNMDMIGRNWPDTVETIGMTFSSLGPTLDSVAAAHRDLNMTPVNDLAPEDAACSARTTTTSRGPASRSSTSRADTTPTITSRATPPTRSTRKRRPGCCSSCSGPARRSETPPPSRPGIPAPWSRCARPASRFNSMGLVTIQEARSAS